MQSVRCSKETVELFCTPPCSIDVLNETHNSGEKEATDLSRIVRVSVSGGGYGAKAVNILLCAGVLSSCSEHLRGECSYQESSLSDESEGTQTDRRFVSSSPHTGTNK